MIYAIIIYILIMLCISIYDYFKVNNFEDFAVAGKNQGFKTVFLSLMASIIGASATIGLADRVIQVGFPAFWWLGVGTFGLILQSIFLSEKIRALNANTLPDIAKITVGNGAKTMLAILIVISWVGIIAAQMVSLSVLVKTIFGKENSESIIIFIGIFVIIYTLIGGQLSVLKTDRIQSLMIGIGIIITVIYLVVTKGGSLNSTVSEIEVVNSDVQIIDILSLFFIVGGTYFLGPDIISRNLFSKDGKIAKRAAFFSGVGLFIFAILITFIGLWAKVNIDDLKGINPLVHIMSNYVPLPVEILLCLALIATLVSSADTCLINAATIMEYDILGKKRVWVIRVMVVLLGACALIMAMYNKDIIGLLTGAYSIYSPAIVCPLCVAICVHKHKSIRKRLWYMAVLCGGILGILSTYFGVGGDYLPLIAMGISLVLSILSIKREKFN